MPAFRTEPIPVEGGEPFSTVLEDLRASLARAHPELGEEARRGLHLDLRDGSFQGRLLFEPGGRCAGFIGWSVTPGLGRRARVHLLPEFQDAPHLVAAVEELERAAPEGLPVVSLDSYLPALPLPAASGALAGLGFLPLSSRAHRMPAGSRTPTAELPEGLTERPLRPSDEPQMARVTQIAYAQNPLDRTLVAVRLDPREDAAQLTRATIQGKWGEWLAWASFGLFVEGRLVAESWVVSGPRGPWLANVAVDPLFQGRGCGARVVARSARALRDRGIAELGLRVTEENVEAVRLYRRLGFVPEGSTPWTGWVKPSALGLSPSR